MTRVWLPLAACRLADASSVGAKAALLGEAHAQGLPVRNGIVLLQSFWEQFARATDILDESQAALRAAAQDDFEPARSFTQKLAVLEWPPEILIELEAAIGTLGAEQFSVEGSVLGGLDYKYAPTLSPLAQTNLADAINQVWSAAFEPQVLKSILSQGCNPALYQLNPIIQVWRPGAVEGRMVSADISNPGSSRLLLETFGEDVCVNRLPRVGLLPESLAWAGSMRAAILRLARVIGEPVIIEFMREPSPELVSISTTKALKSAIPEGLWQRHFTKERFPTPLSPLSWSLLLPAFDASWNAMNERLGFRRPPELEVATVMNGYVYHAEALAGAPQLALGKHLRSVPRYLRTVARYLKGTSFRAWRRVLASSESFPGDLTDSPKFLVMAAIFEAFVFENARTIQRDCIARFRDFQDQLESLANADLQLASDIALIQSAEQIQSAYMAYLEPDLAIQWLKFTCQWMLSQIDALSSGSKPEGSVTAVSAGIVSRSTHELYIALEELHQAVAADAYLATALKYGDRAATTSAWASSPARPLRDKFIATFGHSSLSWDIRIPTYGEYPELLQELLFQRLRNPEVGRAESSADAFKGEREQALHNLHSRLGDTQPAVDFLSDLVQVLHDLMRLEEEHHFVGSRVVPLARRLYVEVGRRLVERGLVTRIDDIYFLTASEINELLATPETFTRRYLIDNRRSTFEAALTSEPSSNSVVSESIGTEAQNGRSSGLLTGKTGNPGIAEGRVRIVATLGDLASFQAGEILVAPTPNPSFAPLFTVAAGLITAHGTSLSPGLNTAREFGVPAVVEVPDAMNRLNNGQRVRIDGMAGTIVFLNESPILPFKKRNS